jgi:hypothetical protein
MAGKDHPDGDEDPFPVSDQLGSAIQTVKVVQDCPVLFADGVISQWYSPGGVSKFYLARLDPNPQAVGDPKEVPVLQVVMPTDGFVAMVAFLESRIRAMMRAGVVSEEQLAKAREKWMASE